jgi:hypothetical protein
MGLPKGRGGRKAMRVATALTGMTGLAAAGGIAAGAEPALAGTNGQHVEVCGLPHHDSVSIFGDNQNSSLIATGVRNVGNNSCWDFTAYWFKNTIDVNWGPAHNLYNASYPYILPDNPNGNTSVYYVQ